MAFAFTSSCSWTAAASEDTEFATASPGALTSSWGTGQRVELPDVGFAVTSPGDWTIKLVGAGSEPSILVESNR